MVVALLAECVVSELIGSRFFTSILVSRCFGCTLYALPPHHFLRFSRVDRSQGMAVFHSSTDVKPLRLIYFSPATLFPHSISSI